MSKKDYELIARLLKQANASEELIRSFAYALREGNRAFKIERFLQACTPTEHAQ